MKRVFLGLLLFVMLFIVSACTGKDIEDDAEKTENQETEMIDMGIFDFETKKVMLNSGYEMPIMGLGKRHCGHTGIRKSGSYKRESRSVRV